MQKVLCGLLVWVGLAECRISDAHRIPTDYPSSRMRTEYKLDVLSGWIQLYYDLNGKLPSKFDEVDSVRGISSGIDKNALPPWEKAIEDGWWNPIVYQKIDENSYRLSSYGEDKKPGGTGNAADITIIRHIGGKEAL
ncbi:MAG: type II secretion system protein GspG [Planctomycetia bacterium]|nr:type II secretion system protein GspG [Planctomycetia bacterium]